MASLTEKQSAYATESSCFGTDDVTKDCMFWELDKK